MKLHIVEDAAHRLPFCRKVRRMETDSVVVLGCAETHESVSKWLETPLLCQACVKAAAQWLYDEGARK